MSTFKPPSQRTLQSQNVLTVERMAGRADAWPVIERIAATCRALADAGELRVRAQQLADLAEAGDVHIVWGRLDADENRRPVAMGGLAMFGRTAGELWGVVSGDLDAGERFGLARYLARLAPLLLQARKMLRLQATARSTDVAACRLREVMGMHYEGTLRCYGPGGESHSMYSLTIDDDAARRAPQKGGA